MSGDVARIRTEITSLRGWRPKPLDDYAMIGGQAGNRTPTTALQVRCAPVITTRPWRKVRESNPRGYHTQPFSRRFPQPTGYLPCGAPGRNRTHAEPIKSRMPNHSATDA